MNCYLCASPATRSFLQVKNHSLVICGNCGLVYERDRQNGCGISLDEDKFLAEYLAEEERYARYFHQKLDAIEARQSPGRVLDLGCGAGTFLRCARERGWQVVGVEGSAPAVAHARGTGLGIHEGLLEDLNLPGPFDVVTAFQVIEHVADPVGFLRNVRQLLKPGGFTMLSTPDRKSFLGKLMGRHWFGYYNDEHVFFYDAGSLRATLANVGLSDVDVTSENGRVLSPTWVFTRLSDYYYTHAGLLPGYTRPGLLPRLFVKSKPIWTSLDWIRFREPSVNLVAWGWNR